MKLGELQSVQSRERQTDQLQQLRSTFYEEAGEFIAQLREERERAADRAEDPFDSPEVNRLSDDITTAEQTVEAIYERRVGKIVKMASLAAADMPTEEDGLTQEERALFERMVDAIEANRKHVLDVVAGEAPSGAVVDEPGTSAPETATREPASEVSEPEVNAADIMGGGTTDAVGDSGPSGGDDTGQSRSHDDPATADASDRPPEEALSAIDGDTGTTPGGSPGGVDRKTVRITDDVGEIFGVDEREYDLSTDDVVTLPADNADPLVERDAAEPLE